MRTGWTTIATVLILGAAPALAAPDPAAPCPTSAAPLPAPLAGWKDPYPLSAAIAPAGLDRAPMAIGKAVSLGLIEMPSIRFATTPGKPGKGAFGGMATFQVTAAGTYRVSLAGGAWVDVLADGKPLASIAHGHGPACSGIAKIVDFALQPGAYVLQIAGSPTPSLAVMVTRGE